MKKITLAAALAAISFGGAAHAQSSVTLYGAVDEGLNFTTNAGGHRGYEMVSGDTAESSWGLKGSEDLGGALSAIFQLENGFNADNGALNEGGREFGRQAFVGLSSTQFGTLTLGRQYDATIDMWSPFTAAGSTIGDLAAHPFDNDNSDYDFRINNSVKYVSPSFRGLQGEAVYGFSNATGFAENRAYSAAGTYTMGGFSAALAYSRQDNGGTTAGGAVGSDDVFTAASQQNIDAGVKWTFSDKSNVAFAYSHTALSDPTANVYVADIGSQGWNSWKFDNFEINGQYFIRPDVFVVGAYTFTHAKLNGMESGYSPNWQQVSMMLDYDISKRTSIYFQGAWQHTNAKTGTGFDDAYLIGSAGASSGENQMLYRIALMHHF